ncbi:hypothetical protein [Reinekea sp. G2M2-21]|uniref:hypothetical protein n=1 Tax=Reinekea sp. G2M2-21 TaxID=2788942 RepID=UPI0018ABE197|nr:hypothetical protein [Reinekea sp. G2M2-21]
MAFNISERRGGWPNPERVPIEALEIETWTQDYKSHSVEIFYYDKVLKSGMTQRITETRPNDTDGWGGSKPTFEVEGPYRVPDIQAWNERIDSTLEIYSKDSPYEKSDIRRLSPGSLQAFISGLPDITISEAQDYRKLLTSNKDESGIPKIVITSVIDDYNGTPFSRFGFKVVNSNPVREIVLAALKPFDDAIEQSLSYDVKTWLGSFQTIDHDFEKWQEIDILPGNN